MTSGLPFTAKENTSRNACKTCIPTDVFSAASLHSTHLYRGEARGPEASPAPDNTEREEIFTNSKYTRLQPLLAYKNHQSCLFFSNMGGKPQDKYELRL